MADTQGAALSTLFLERLGQGSCGGHLGMKAPIQDPLSLNGHKSDVSDPP